ncbi:MAG: InlB B-repeat-containing protein, partial [Steroidobacteraceae bacterium]
DGVPQRAVVQVLDEQGSEIERVVAPLPLTFISRIGDAARGAPAQLLGNDPEGRAYRLELHEAEPRFRNLRQLNSSGEVEFTGDGGVAAFYNLSTSPGISRYDTQDTPLETIRLLTNESNTDRAFAVLEIEPGEFVIAGDSNGLGSTGTRKGVAWVLRYNLRSDRIVWQRRFEGPAQEVNGTAPFGQVVAIAPGGDGSVVVGGNIGVESAVIPGAGRGSPSRLVKLDAEGLVLWQSPVLGDGFLRELHATHDGGFVALLADGVLVKLAGDGAVEWRRRYEVFGDKSVALADDDGDGARDDGYLLAADDPAEGEPGIVALLLRLDALGLPLWSRAVRIPEVGAFALTARRLRSSPDGGYVLGATEVGVRERVDPQGNTLPLGQSNLLLVKLDRAANALWGRVYGALYDEELNDLRVLDSGLILAGGYSDSLGDRREAWLLKLGPDGMINEGCSALLANFRSEEFRADPRAVPSQELLPALSEVGPPQVLHDTSAPLSTASDGVTARQCLGGAADANPPISPVPSVVSLALDFNGSGIGRVQSAPAGLDCRADCQADFARDTDVTLTATPDPGYVLESWANCVADGLQCRVRLGAAGTVRVTFTPDPQTARVLRVTRGGNGGGEVTSSPPGIACGEDCSESYADNTSVTLTALPADGSRFSGWNGCDSVNTDTQCIVAINADRDVSATFEAQPEEVTLTVLVVSTGPEDRVTSQGIDCGTGGTGDCVEVLPRDATVFLTANSGDVVWAGCDEVRDSRICRLTMNTDRSVRADFP